MERHDQGPPAGEELHNLPQSQAQSSSPPAAGPLHPTNEKPRTSLHSYRNSKGFGHAGRHSLDVVRPPPAHENGRQLPKADRSHSVPFLAPDGTELGPDQPLPIHAPTNVQSQRQRAVRSSAEFDRRFDGPFGRPSLAMARRRSSRLEEALAEGDQPVETRTDGQGENQSASGASGSQLLEPKPPPLNYTLRTRKMAIFIFWSFIVFDSVVMPIALYFGLWYGVGPPAKKQTLSANAVFSIVTAAIGGASIVEYAVRFWRLWKKGSTCRVIGARRWYLDLFHWNYSLAWIIVMFELIM